MQGTDITNSVGVVSNLSFRCPSRTVQAPECTIICWRQVLDKLDNLIFWFNKLWYLNAPANRFSAKVVNGEQSWMLSSTVQWVTNQSKWSATFIRIFQPAVKLAISHPQKQRRHSVIKHHKFSTGKSQDSSLRSSTCSISSQLKDKNWILILFRHENSADSQNEKSDTMIVQYLPSFDISYLHSTNCWSCNK